ncbi:hypothetical protein CKM354_001016700 [Cercospora kikuchii]|uniref:Carrier domain-containing protein n=1 Tax=Cercospora kikuchii TaxID=84275 RepID=A0A9P3CQV7_9PEZI|nr:uncharacterized protein CKM354_001016700 [Cercospora kikuchii]GIZ47066.1 hypothetical protein CKM354_001016700 [Cercospora kikuchii]
MGGLSVTDGFRHHNRTPEENACIDLAKRPSRHVLVPPADDECNTGAAYAPFSLLPSSGRTSDTIAHAANLCGVSPSSVVDILPCTPLQEGLMALGVKNPGNYVVQFSYQIGPDVDLDHLTQAWKEVAMSNPILRTRILSLATATESRLWQAILDEPLGCNIVDTLDDCASRNLHMGLSDPLSRITITRKQNASGHRHVHWQIHHAIFDGWSLDLLLDDVERAYNHQPRTPLWPMQYLINHLHSQDQGAQKLFWREYFNNTRGMHFPSSPLGLQASPDSQLESTLTAISWEKCDYTKATIIAAAWALAVANESGGHEALFGLTVNGRQGSLEVIGLVAGPTIATVPKRVVMNPSWCYEDLLSFVQHESVAMLPFEQTGLQNIRAVSDEAAIGCSFQSLLVVQPQLSNADSTASNRLLQELDTDNDSRSPSTSDTYAVVVQCWPDKDSLRVRIAFDSNLISEKQTEFVAASFRHAVMELSDHNRAASEIQDAQMGSWSLHQIWEWNNALPETTPSCVHDVIASRARERPLAFAINAWDGNFTYGELEDATTKLALHIRPKMVAGETIVPILFERSKWQTVAALGVIKAGAACLCLDSRQPVARLRTILAQVGTEILLCSSSNVSLASKIGAQRLVVVGSDSMWLREEPSGTLPLVKPSDTLYVNFTSGSTGVPKGAMNTHQSFCSAITHQQKLLQFSEESRVLDFAACSFDAWWANCLHSLTSGGCLCIPSQEERDNDLAGCLERYSINSVDLTPSVARIIGPSALSRLSTLILGGEPVIPEDAHLAGPQTRIFNVYGPAECTITATIAEILPNDISIGHGRGVCTWVVDPDSQTLSRIGAVGELWLEGPLVGQGYLHDPVRTEECFVENPAWLAKGISSTIAHSSRTGRQGRVYRTGDLARYRSDGSLEYIGRKDRQAKIRGQRLELSEVEHHVKEALSSSVSAIVTAEIIQPSNGGSAVLVAFVTLKQDTESAKERSLHDSVVHKAVHGLSARLLEKIPSYLVPSAFFPLMTIPSMASDKIDRNALQELGKTRWSQHQDNENSIDTEPTTQPQSTTQSILQEIWMSVLNLSQTDVTVDKAFTRLGGDSISAMQVVAQGKLRNLLFTVTDILETATIRRLASRCRIATTHDAGKTTTSEEEKELGREDKFFGLSPIQQMFFDLYPDGLNHWNQSFLLELNKPVSKEVLAAALEAIVARHEMLRCYFDRDSKNHCWMQRIMPMSECQYPVLVEHMVESREAVQNICQSRQKSFDLRRGGLFVGDLFQVESSNTQLLLLSAHHAIIDLVSWRILWADIEDFVEHGSLRSHATASFQHWLQRQNTVGATLSPLAALPYAVPKPQMDFWGLAANENTFEGCEAYSLVFDAELTASLFGEANEALRSEPIDIIITALTRSFWRTFPEREPVVVWLEGHGRESSDDLPLDITNTVGWFTTLCPCPLPMSSESTLLELVRLAKDNRRRVPGKGQPYFSCRYQSKSGQEAFGSHDFPEMVLNFSGQFQQLEAETGLFKRPESLGTADLDLCEMSPTAQRSSAIEVSAERCEDEFLVTFHIHKNMRHQERLQSWTRCFAQDLNTLTQELQKEPPSFTLTDLPLLSLSYESLDMILRQQLPRAGIPMHQVADMYPCLPAQEGMRVSIQSGSASYTTSNIWTCVRGPGATSPLSSAKLEQAWRTVVKRHSILQTVFMPHPENGGFIQILLRNPETSVKHIRIASDTHQSATATLATLDPPHFLPHQVEHAFTICEDPSNGELACRLDANHSLIDAASLGLIVTELVKTYDDADLSFANTTAAAPPFRDVVRHVVSISQAQRLSAWERLLQNVKPCILPTQRSEDLHRDLLRDERFAVLEVPRSEMHGVAEFCATRGLTRFVFVQVIWALVLAQFTGQREVCFGYLSHGRDIPVDGIETMVGPLVSLLVSRIDVRASAEEVFRRVSRDTIEHRNIQHTSLAEILHVLAIRGKQQHGLFNSTVSVRGAELAMSSGSFSLQEMGGEDRHEFDVGLSVALEREAMAVVVEYREATIPVQTAQAVAQMLKLAVRYLLENPGDDGVCVGPGNAANGLWHGFFRYVVGCEEHLAESMWREQLDGLQATHFPLSSDGAAETTSVCRVEVDVPEVRTHGMEPEVTLRTAWALLSSRMTGSDEAVFGILPAAGNGIVDPLPMRFAIDMSSSLSTFIRQVEYRGATIRKLQRTPHHWLRLMSDEAAFACDFQIVLEVGSKKSTYEPLTVAAPLRCTLDVQREKLYLSCNSGTFTESQAERLVNQLRHVISQVLGQDLHDVKLASLNLTNSQDIQQIWQWNANVPETVSTCVHSLVTLKVHEQPSCPAVCAWDGSLTYKELDDLSTQVAKQLTSRGTVHGTAVLLLFEKSMWMPVAALAVMKCGAAAVATDPSTQPEERLAAMARQAQCTICLSSASHIELAQRICDTAMVVGSDLYIESTQFANQELPVVSPSDLLYIQFTSGTTGNPKGVMITHQNMCSALEYQRMSLNYQRTSRVLDFASYAFDVFWSNLVHTLTIGACFCIPSPDERMNDLSGALLKYDITLADLTPSIARHLSGIERLSTLILGGEVVLSSDWHLLAEHIEVRNAYGPAECTPTATVLKVTTDTKSRSIGRPVGLCAWVVSQEDSTQLCPIGAVGELYLEGPLVGEGYVGNASLTSKSFIRDLKWLTSEIPGLQAGRPERLYRTGDLARFDEDGSIVFLGRKDTMVKIRGQRVELEEVEHGVRSVLETMNVATKRFEGAEVVAEVVDTQLVAFVSLQQVTGDHEATVRRLSPIATEKLASRLPTYMLPSKLISLQDIPRTATGKIDRPALRAFHQRSQSGIENEGTKRLTARREPGTKAEKLVQKVWAEILEISPDAIGLDDSFFRLGGDSIGAMRFVGLARRHGISQFTVRDVFQNPVLADLASLAAVEG